MGYLRRHAIIVTGSYGNHIELAHKRAIEIFPEISEIVYGTINHERSFLVPPDGSKEDWPESDEGDDRRRDFIKYLKTTKYEDGSSPLSWVEVQYGDDANKTLIVDCDDYAALKALGVEEGEDA